MDAVDFLARLHNRTQACLSQKGMAMIHHVYTSAYEFNLMMPVDINGDLTVSRSRLSREVGKEE